MNKLLTIFVAGLMALSSQVTAQDRVRSICNCRTTVLVGSYHPVGYSYLQQDNLGLIFSWDTPQDTYISTGVYRNSYYGTSTLATVSKSLYKKGDLSVDIFAGVAYYPDSAQYTGAQLGDTDFIGLAGVTFVNGRTFSQSMLGVNSFGFSLK